MENTVFEIVPANSSRTYWTIFTILCRVVVFIAVVLVLSGRGEQSTRFEVTPTHLKISGGMHSKTMLQESLVLGGAQVVDLTGTQELRPTYRTSGTGMSGYSAG